MGGVEPVILTLLCLVAMRFDIVLTWPVICSAMWHIHYIMYHVLVVMGGTVNSNKQANANIMAWEKSPEIPGSLLLLPLVNDSDSRHRCESQMSGERDDKYQLRVGQCARFNP